MEEEKKQELLTKAKDFFRDEIIAPHTSTSCEKIEKLSEFQVNPFLVKYLACFLEGNLEPKSIAKALIYPRILGTSITTSFGSKVQKMISSLFEGYGSAVSGIDIEFIDAIDGRKKYCQLKAGPNTINKDDVKTVCDHFDAVKNLSRTNNLNIGLEDLIVGVLYGEENELSAHYKNIQKSYPVYIGQEFWKRLTGDENFYFELTNAIGEVAIEVDGRATLEKTINALAAEIEKNPL